MCILQLSNGKKVRNICYVNNDKYSLFRIIINIHYSRIIILKNNSPNNYFCIYALEILLEYEIARNLLRIVAFFAVI